jgi:DNA-directed RNA polymerase specialized sigma24 family protein
MESRMKSLKLFVFDQEADDLRAQVTGSKAPQERPILFEERFWQWRDSLLFIAYRILGDTRSAAEAVENCFLTASRNPSKFASDGAFGSWILRILIDEVVLIRLHQKSRAAIACEQIFSGVSPKAF